MRRAVLACCVAGLAWAGCGEKAQRAQGRRPTDRQVVEAVRDHLFKTSDSASHEIKIVKRGAGAMGAVGAAHPVTVSVYLRKRQTMRVYECRLSLNNRKEWRARCTLIATS
ncbi:MAG: hypothetical protein ABI333_05695 [bacterium]